jgi:hypothetical protein
MGSIRSLLVGLGVIAGMAVMGPASGAGAASGKTVNFGNNTEITVAPGWSIGKVTDGKLAITKNSPHAVIEVASGAVETGSVTTNDNTNFSQFAKGFGLKGIKISGRQTAQIPGGGKFDEASSVTYTGNYQGQKLGGLAVEYQNSTSGDGAFAIVIAKQSDKPKLKSVISKMFQSIATNP